MDGLNECRTARVAEVLADFRTLQYYIAAGPVEPENVEDYYTEGWAALRQCTIDGQHILDCAADTRVPMAQGGEEEQTKAELTQVLLDAYSRRHEGQKILLRQGAAQRWIEYRNQVLQGQRPHPGNHPQLHALDDQLRAVSSDKPEHRNDSPLSGQQQQQRNLPQSPTNTSTQSCWQLIKAKAAGRLRTRASGGSSAGYDPDEIDQRDGENDPTIAIFTLRR
ncbi:hypothetical protein PT974_11646 [Cladobotryum mycophilum]|uniref:Uncharacterized protein n=1 Tax=Cladobotryum mycophilum TaxID=491253 RepID=A0ABR0S6U0_9HYPO